MTILQSVNHSSSESNVASAQVPKSVPSSASIVRRGYILDSIFITFSLLMTIVRLAQKSSEYYSCIFSLHPARQAFRDILRFRLDPDTFEASKPVLVPQKEI